MPPFNPQTFNPQMNYLMEMQQKQQKNQLDIQKEIAIKQARDNISLQTYAQKLQMKEWERERKKAQYEEVQIIDGQVEVRTRNLYESKPRAVTNLSYPALTVLKRIADETDIAYRISFQIGNKEKAAFLDKVLSGKGSYIVKKLAAEGVDIFADAKRKKEYASQLLAVLLTATDKEEEWIADQAGWVTMPGGEIKYIEEGELTWEKIKKLIR